MDDLSISGYDVDSDRIRDDLERYIRNTYPTEPDTRASLYYISLVMSYLFNYYQTHETQGPCFVASYQGALNNLKSERQSKGDYAEVLADALAQVTNTYQRSIIYSKASRYDDGTGTGN